MKAMNYRYVRSLGFIPTEILYGIEADLRVDIHLGTINLLKAALERGIAAWPLGKSHAVAVLERTAKMEARQEDVAKIYVAKA